MLCGEIDSDREFRLALQGFCCVGGGRDVVTHLRESGRKKGMMSVVRPGDPGERLSSFGVSLGAIAGAPEVTPEALGVIGVEAHGFLYPVDAFFRPPKPRQKLALLHYN